MKASVAITVLSFLSAASALPISKVTAGIGPQHTERAVLPPFLPKTRPHEKTSTTSSAQLQNTEVYKPSSPYDTRPPKVVIQIIDGVEVKQCESFSATGGSHVLGPCPKPPKEKYDWREGLGYQWCGNGKLCPTWTEKYRTRPYSEEDVFPHYRYDDEEKKGDGSS